MAHQPDVAKPTDDPYSLVGDSWPKESENSYHAAETVADDGSATASTQSQSAADAGSKMGDEHGKTADAVSNGYNLAATTLGEQSRSFTTISAWMVEAAGKVRTAKTDIASLVRTGTSEIQDALNSELTGTPVTPSSSALIDQYRGEIASVATTLSSDLDGIGHSLVGDPGASRTPTYVRAAASPTAPSIEQAAVHHGITGEGPHVEPQKLPEMPRATATQSTESSSAPSAPAPSAAPHSVNPTLAGLISGNASPSGSATAPSASSSRGAASGTTPAGQGAQAHQPSEQHQAPKSTVLPRVPSVPLPDLPAAAATITTAVTSATGQQLPVTSTAPAPAAPLAPASTGFTPGASGTSPVPSGLAPIGGGLTTPPPVTQSVTPAVQGTPSAPAPGVQAPSAPQTPAPATPRGPVADMAWLQKTYGLAPGLDLPKPENAVIPALFIAELSEPEAHLHRALASLRQQFESMGWSQPISVATIRRGLEVKTVYATADGIAIHPSGVSLPHGVLPLDEMPGIPVDSRLEGSLIVTEKLVSLVPRGWEVESLLSTVSGGEGSQSIEEYQQLVSAGELLECMVSRGQDDVDADVALRVFARAAIGSGGCGELDAESARLRSARWVGMQPVGYLDGLSRWYLADAADSMSAGRWGEAVWASEKYMSLNQSRSQVA